MARELSATLEAAQNLGAVTWPYLIAKIRRKWGGIVHYEDWTNIYSGEEVEALHTATMPSDGSLIRLRVNTDASNTLYYQRVENPSPESDFTSWTYQNIYNVEAVASCSYGVFVAQFAIRNDRATYFRESSDCGASWTSWSIVTYDVATNILFADAAYKPNTDIALATVDSDALCVTKRVSSVWGAKSNATSEPSNITGVSVLYNSDWNIVITYGAADAVNGVQQVIFGDGGSYAVGVWSDWEVIIERPSTEPFIYYSPFMRRPDTTRLFFCEKYTESVVTEHIFYSHSPEALDFDDAAWLEPVPMEIEGQWGFCPVFDADYIWLCSANKIYRASTSDDELDISSKILIVDINQSPDRRSGKLKLTLDNSGGIFNSFDRVGDEITIGLGFVTAAGNEYSLTSSFWITKYQLISPSWSIWTSLYPSGILGTLYIEAQDAWHFLKKHKSRRAIEWEAGEKTVKQLLTYCLARAGLALDVISESTAVTTFEPEFTINRSSSYATAVKNLLKMVPDQLVFRESKALIRYPQASDSVDWLYHNTIGLAILVFRGKYGTSAWDPNRVEVWGDTVMVASAEYPQIERLRDRLSRVTTPDYPDEANAALRAAGDLRKAEVLTGEDSWLFAMVNCGLEPWDKIQITDQAAGVSNIFRRVIRIKTYWTKRTYQYTQTLTLGAD